MFKGNIVIGGNQSNKTAGESTTNKSGLDWLNKWGDKEHTKELEFYWRVVKNAKDNKKDVSDLKSVFKISKEIEKELETDLK